MAAKSKGSSKEPRAINPVKAILRDNVRALLDHHFPPSDTKFKNGRGQIQAFLRKHHYGWSRRNLSKLQRAKNEGSCNLDTVHQLATGFELQAYQLFIRGLDVKQPQIAVSVKQIDSMLAQAKKTIIDGGTEE